MRRLRTHTSRASAGFAALALLAGLCGVTACSAGTRGSSDPGGHQLAQLRADPLFGALPPGATADGPVLTSPAVRRSGAFGGGADSGPAVSARLSSTQPSASVFQFYAELAAANGWTARTTNAAGLTNQWHKRYPSGLQADAVLSALDPNGTAPGSLHLYALDCGAATR